MCGRLYYGWVVVLGALMCNFLQVGLTRSMGIFFYVFLDKFHETAAATATFLSTGNTLRMVLGPVASLLCERFGCRPVVMCGGFMFGVGYILTTQAQNVLGLNLTYGVICGVGASFIFTPPYIIVGQYFTKNTGRAMSLATIGAGIGTMAMAPFENLLLKHYGSFGALLITGGVVFNIIVAGALFRPPPPLRRHEDVMIITKPLDTLKAERADFYSSMDRISVLSVPIKDHDHDKDRGGSELWSSDINISVDDLNEAIKEEAVKETKESTKELSNCQKIKQKFTMFTNRTFWIYLLNVGTMPFVLMTPMILLPSLALEIGASKNMASIVLSIMGLADILGRFFFGFLFDISVIRDMKRRQLAFGLIGVLFGLFTAALGACTNVIMLGCGVAVYGIMEGGYHSQRMTVLSEVLPPHLMPSAVGWSIFAQGLGNLISSPLLGLLRDYSGTFKIGYYCGGALFILASSCFIVDYFCREPRTELDQEEK